jgi:hypothetical protein
VRFRTISIISMTRDSDKNLRRACHAGSGRCQLSRRMLLRAAGAGIALPLLDAMLPGLGRAARAEAAAAHQRLVAIHVPLGMMPQFFFPEKDKAREQEKTGTAAGGPSSPYLDLLADHRGQFTVFSGMSHPEVDGNHHAGQCFLTGAPHPGQPTFRNSVSVDQLAAETIGLDTRFPFLPLSVQASANYTNSLSVSLVPAPGALSLLACAGGACAARRRRA